MKKLLIILSISCLISCSSDDSNNTSNPENNNNELQLSSYERTFPSGNTATYNFESGKLIDHYNNGNLSGEFEYNTQEKMISYTKYSSSGNIDRSYTFNYDENDKLISIDEYNQYPFSGNPNNYNVPVSIENNYISAQIPTEFSSDGTTNDPKDILEFTLNNDGYVSSSKYTDSNGEVKIDVNYAYDTNFNCTQYEFSINNQTIAYTHQYDNAPNPVEDFYRQYYIQNLLIHGRVSGFGSYSLASIVDTFGSNNRTTNGYPAGIPVSSHTFLEYTYNDDGYPVTGNAKYVSDPSAYASQTTFYY